MEQVSKQKALNHNFGGVTNIAEYDSKQMRVNSRPVQIKSTAYMLVYVNDEVAKDLFVRAFLNHKDVVVVKVA